MTPLAPPNPDLPTYEPKAHDAPPWQCRECSEQTDHCRCFREMDALLTRAYGSRG